MIKVFLDTNVILDYYLDRESFSDEAETILSLGFGHAYQIYVSALTFANIAYIARKKFPGDMIYTVLGTLQEFAEVTPVDSYAIQSAVNLKADDFEDALQYFSAWAVDADYIVTRNVKDFAFSKILVLTPHEFLDKVQTLK